MSAEFGSNSGHLQHRIRILEERLGHILSDAERVGLLRQIRDLKQKSSISEAGDLATQKSPTLWTPNGPLLAPEVIHKHNCSTCERLFSHDVEETECPEINGKFYCEVCFETAAEHFHKCPACGAKWAHYAAPDCDL